MSARTGFALGARFEDQPLGPITLDQIRDFARASGDPNPIHVDPQAAIAFGLEAPPVHGMQLVALMHDAAARNLPDALVTGLSTRFLAPVPAGSTMAETALRFILSNPDVATVIPGMRRPEHVRSNLAAGDAGPLPPDLLALLRAHRWDRTPTEWSQ